MRLVFLFIILPFLSFSQDTTQKSIDTLKRNGSFGLTGIVNNPNVGNKQIILQSSLLNYLKYKRSDYTLDGNYLRSYSAGKKIQDDGSILIQPRLVYQDWNSFVFSQIIKAYSRKLDIRYEFEIGGGRAIYRSRSFSFLISYAILYDKSTYNNDSLSTKTVRNSFKVKFLGDFDRISYLVVFYYQPNMNDWSQYNYRTKIEINYYLSRRIFISAIYNDSYESFIVYGNHLVSNLTFGLKVHY